MTGSIYHNCSMSQRPIRGGCEYRLAGTGADGLKWKEEINAAGDGRVRKYGDRGGYKEEPASL